MRRKPVLIGQIGVGTSGSAPHILVETGDGFRSKVSLVLTPDETLQLVSDLCDQLRILQVRNGTKEELCLSR